MDVEAVAIDSPMSWAQNHIRQYLVSDGAAVEHPNAESLILLYTKGRRTGQIRRIPIVALADGGDLLVMASKGGAPTHPEWYLNLSDDQNVWVRDKGEFYEATAATVDAEDRPAAFAKFVAKFPGFQEYEDKTPRVIPIVRISRRA